MFATSTTSEAAGWTCMATLRTPINSSLIRWRSVQGKDAPLSCRRMASHNTGRPSQRSAGRSWICTL